MNRSGYHSLGSVDRCLLLVRVNPDRDLTDPLFRLAAKQTLSRFLLRRVVPGVTSVPDVSRMDLRVVRDEDGGKTYLAAEYPVYTGLEGDLLYLVAALCVDRAEDVRRLELGTLRDLLVRRETNPQESESLNFGFGGASDSLN